MVTIIADPDAISAVREITIFQGAELPAATIVTDYPTGRYPGFDLDFLPITAWTVVAAIVRIVATIITISRSFPIVPRNHDNRRSRQAGQGGKMGQAEIQIDAEVRVGFCGGREAGEAAQRGNERGENDFGVHSISWVRSLGRNSPPVYSVFFLPYVTRR